MSTHLDSLGRRVRRNPGPFIYVVAGLLLAAVHLLAAGALTIGDAHFNSTAAHHLTGERPAAEAPSR